MNIWSIKSKALRAIVAWLAAGLAAVVVLVALPFVLAFLVVHGTLVGIKDFWRGLTKGWGDAPSAWWRAATGKEAV